MVWIGNGIDLDRFQPRAEVRRQWREKLGISESAPVIGMMCRLDPIKDVPNFLSAVANMQIERPDAQFALCGEDVSFAGDEVRQAYEALPDKNRLHWLGFHPNAAEVYPVV